MGAFKAGQLKSMDEAGRLLMESIAYLVANLRGLCLVPLTEHLSDELIRHFNEIFLPVGVRVCRESWPGLGHQHDKADVPCARFEPIAGWEPPEGSPLYGARVATGRVRLHE
jgi:hypothetical protein